MTRGQIGRSLARIELGVAAGICFVVIPFIYVAAPGKLEPMFNVHPWQETALTCLGFAGLLIGFIWTVRIYRANPEPDQRAWRYRRD